MVLEEKIYNFTIRLFIDNSIYNDKKLFDLIYGLERVEIVIYTCSNYLEDDKIHHYGLFGTLVRFFPMFNFPNNDANIIFIMDMDDYYIFNSNIKILDSIDKKMLDIIYLIKKGNLYNSRFNYEIDYKSNINPYCFAQRFISFKRLDYSIIQNYLINFNDENVKVIINTYGF